MPTICAHGHVVAGGARRVATISIDGVARAHLPLRAGLYAAARAARSRAGAAPALAPRARPAGGARPPAAQVRGEAQGAPAAAAQAEDLHDLGDDARLGRRLRPHLGLALRAGLRAAAAGARAGPRDPAPPGGH